MLDRTEITTEAELRLHKAKVEAALMSCPGQMIEVLADQGFDVVVEHIGEQNAKHLASVLAQYFELTVTADYVRRQREKGEIK